MDFDEWKKENLSRGESKTWVEWCELAFEAGQQSKQAEIDKIKQLLKQWDDWISVSDGNNHIDIIKECADELRELLK